MKKENPVKILMGWAGPNKIYLVLSVICALICGLCAVIPYLGVYRLINAILEQTAAKEFILQNVLLITGFTVVRFVFFALSGAFSHKGAYGSLFRARCMVIDHMAKVPLGALNERRTGDIKAVLNEDIEKLEEFLAHNIPDLVHYLVGPVAIFIYLLTINVPLALVSIFPLILCIIIMGVMFMQTAGIMDRYSKSIAGLNSVFIEYINGMKLIKAYNMGSSSFEKFSDAIQEENDVVNTVSRKMGPPYSAYVILIEEYNSETPVLRHCNLKIKQGEKIALIGRSGAGKSTIIQLIARSYEVGNGNVRIGGIDVRNISYNALLENIAIVFQKTFLTDDSVFENICMGSHATLDEVRAAARKAQIDDFIMSLPDGYDTKVGSFSSRFSGGEKQRIAIARAILKNAPILILDEATSAADPENQVEIDKAIENLCKGKTVLVVAHRLGAVKMCDKVAILENGSVTSYGTHEAVLKENAYYQSAWRDYNAARAINYKEVSTR